MENNTFNLSANKSSDITTDLKYAFLELEDITAAISSGLMILMDSNYCNDELVKSIKNLMKDFHKLSREDRKVIGLKIWDLIDSFLFECKDRASLERQSSKISKSIIDLKRLIRLSQAASQAT